MVEKTFKELISTINDGEVWVNKYKNKRLTKIQKYYDSIIFEFDNKYTEVGVSLNDVFIMERKKYDTGYAMQELLKGKEIESCISKLRYKFIGNDINYFNKDYSCWKVTEYPFSTREITNNWYIND